MGPRKTRKALEVRICSTWKPSGVSEGTPDNEVEEAGSGRDAAGKGVINNTMSIEIGRAQGGNWIGSKKKLDRYQTSSD